MILQILTMTMLLAQETPAGAPKQTTPPQATAPAATPAPTPAPAPRQTAPATPPRGTAPATAPRGAAPATAPRGGTQTTAPRGAAPATAPRGGTQTTAPRGTTPGAAPRGATPATAPRGAAPGATPASTTPKVVAKGSISGIVLQSASGNPLPNVRVTVARTDVPESFTKLARQLIGGPLEGGPRGEVTVPGEFLESMKAEISAELASMKAMQEAGRPQIPGFPPGFSPEDLPPGVSPEEFFGIDPGDFSPEELFGFPPEMAGIADLDLDGVQSLTLDASGKLSMILKSAPPLMTDGSGKFEFRDLDAGTYRLTFVANGYVRQDFGQTGLGGGTPVLLEPGKNLDNLVTRMTQTGVITGRILNTQGKPLAGVPVQLARFAYDASGKKKALPVLSVQTNDRGEYRFYYVMPGRYLVSAGTTGATPGGGYGGYGGYGYGGYADYAALAAYYGYAMGLPGAVPSQNRILDQRFVPAYYPGTPDVNSASPVELAAGGAVSDINLMLASQGSFVVRGRVVDPTGGAPQNASIRLTPQDGNIVPVRGGPNYNQTDGTFEMRDVPNGSYLLIVEMQNRVVQPPRPTGPRNPAEQAEYNIAMQNAQAESRLRAAIPVVVDNRDVNDIVASPAPGGFFNGKVRVEGAGAGKPAAGKPAVQVNRLISEFRPAGSDGTPTTKPGLQPQSPQPRADGTFRVNSVYAGDYWFRIRQLPEGYYIKSARIGETDVLNHAVTLPMSDANLALDIVVSPNVGELEGRALLTDGKAAAGAQVVLVPDKYRERAELFRPTTTDARGIFNIANIEPGEYHLAVWPSMEPFAFFDPAFIAQAQEKGKAVRVGESSKQKVEVETFPSTDPQ